VPPVTAPDLDRFARLDSLGLTVTGQQIFGDHAVLFCQVTVPDDRCPGCGGETLDQATEPRPSSESSALRSSRAPGWEDSNPTPATTQAPLVRAGLARGFLVSVPATCQFVLRGRSPQTQRTAGCVGAKQGRVPATRTHPPGLHPGAALTAAIPQRWIARSLRSGWQDSKTAPNNAQDRPETSESLERQRIWLELEASGQDPGECLRLWPTCLVRARRARGLRRLGGCSSRFGVGGLIRRRVRSVRRHGCRDIADGATAPYVAPDRYRDRSHE